MAGERGGSPLPRPAAVQDLLARADDRGIRTARRPPSAPDRNPVEGGGQPRKPVELGNRICLDLEALHRELARALGRLRQKRRWIQSFVQGAGLDVENLPPLRNAQ